MIVAVAAGQSSAGGTCAGTGRHRSFHYSSIRRRRRRVAGPSNRQGVVVRVLLPAALLALLAAATVGAQPPVPDVLCLPAAPHACVALALVLDGERGALWLQNLQGSRPTGKGEAAQVPFAVTAVAIGRTNPADARGATVESLRLAWDPTAHQTVGGVATGHDPDYFSPGAAPRPWAREQDAAMLDGALYGCDLPWPDPSRVMYLQTCATLGVDGWLRLAFDAAIERRDGGGVARRPLRASDVTIVLHALVGGAPARCALLGAASGRAPSAALPACHAVAPAP